MGQFVEKVKLGKYKLNMIGKGQFLFLALYFRYTNATMCRAHLVGIMAIIS